MTPTPEFDLDTVAPLLSKLELAVAMNTCREAGAVNAANALNKHITRMQIELRAAEAAAFERAREQAAKRVDDARLPQLADAIRAMKDEPKEERDAELHERETGGVAAEHQGSYMRRLRSGRAGRAGRELGRQADGRSGRASSRWRMVRGVR